MKCETPRCRREVEVIYQSEGLCKKCYKERVEGYRRISSIRYMEAEKNGKKEKTK